MAERNILVTRSSMPPMDEFIEEMESLWDSHWLTNMGVKHMELEEMLREYLGIPGIALFTNGHNALECIFEVMGLEGEVITTPFTFASTTHAIVRKRLKPVMCDVRASDCTIDPEQLERLITSRTCAIVPVHVYGNLCDIDAIQQVADAHGLKVIYDAAHAFGVRKDGVSAACFGDASMFSFHATKVFNTIEGGAACFHDLSLRKSFNDWKNFGITGPESVEYVGGNAKMNEFCAAMGLCNLRHLDEEIAKRRAIDERYRERLAGIEGTRVLTTCPEGVERNFAYMPVAFGSDFGATRDEVFDALAQQGIHARKYFYPCTNEFECYEGLLDPDMTPVAHDLSCRVLTLPMYADLSLDDVDLICDTIDSCRSGNVVSLSGVSRKGVRPSIGQIHEFLNAVEGDFGVPLSQKCDLRELAEKFYDKATLSVRWIGGHIAGAVFGYTEGLEDDSAYISVVATRPEYRGRGIARHCVEEFLEVCHDQGIASCRLYTTPDNEAALALYQQLGFEVLHLADEPRPNDVHLEWHDPHAIARPRQLNILLTSAGRRSYLVRFFRHALRGAGQVHVANSSPFSAALHEADMHVITPLIYDEGYIDFLLDYCREHDIGALVPLFDVDLPVIAANRERFLEIGCTPVVSSYETTQICNDKWHTYQFLREHGIDTPRTFLLEHEALEAIEAGELSYPLVIKPRWGMGSIGVRTAIDAEELEVACEETRIEIGHTYLRYESAATADQTIVIQETLTGREYGLDVICDLEGTYLHTVAKLKRAMRSGETDCAVTVDRPELRELGRSLAEALGHCGNLDVDVFVSPERTCVLEMNARFGGGYPFSHMAGVDLPAAIVAWLRGRQIDPAMLQERYGVVTQKDIELVQLEGLGEEDL